MSTLRTYFNDVFRFAADKDAITASTDIADIAAILRAAEARDHATSTSLHATGDDSLFAPYVDRLRAHALKRATQIGLEQTGTAATHSAAVRLFTRLEMAISSARLDLSSDTATLDAISALLVHDTHENARAFITALRSAPDAVCAAAPALAALRDGAAPARIWEADDITTTHSRGEIREAFLALNADLVASVAALNDAARAHLRRHDAVSMAAISGTNSSAPPPAPPAP